MMAVASLIRVSVGVRRASRYACDRRVDGPLQQYFTSCEEFRTWAAFWRRVERGDASHGQNPPTLPRNTTGPCSGSGTTLGSCRRHCPGFLDASDSGICGVRHRVSPVHTVKSCFEACRMDGRRDWPLEWFRNYFERAMSMHKDAMRCHLMCCVTQKNETRNERTCKSTISAMSANLKVLDRRTKCYVYLHLLPRAVMLPIP